MSFEFKDLAERLKNDAGLNAGDTLALRQWAWGSDGLITKYEAESIFELNNLGKSNAREWVDFFVEAISEYVVNQDPPKGYVSNENASWLIGQIDKDGKLESVGELELLVRVLERALNAPDALKTYALRQIEMIILTGEGVTRAGGEIRPGVIDDAEVTLLRRLIFASGGSGPAIVSAEEAEMLFRIKATTMGKANAAVWKQLFVQGVGNHLMAHSSYHQFSRDEAIQKEAFMNATSGGIGGFLSRMLKGADWGGARNAATFDETAEQEKIDAREAAEDASAEVTPIENVWLAAQINADGVEDELEAALLEFLREE